MKAGLLFSIALASSIAAGAEEITTLLVPLYVRGEEISGAFGTRWATEFSVRNGSDDDVVIGPCGPGFPDDPDSPCPPSYKSFPRHAIVKDPDLSFGKAGPHGRLFYVLAKYNEALEYSLTLLRNGRPAARLPVVRAAQFATTVRLIDVPTTAQTRTTVRIYALPNHDATVTVRVYSMPTAGMFPLSQLLGAFSVPIVAIAGYQNHNRLPSAPAYAELSLQAVLAELGATNETGTVLEITVSESTSTIWAFATTTRNDTQEVTVITPDRPQ